MSNGGDEWIKIVGAAIASGVMGSLVGSALTLLSLGRKIGLAEARFMTREQAESTFERRDLSKALLSQNSQDFFEIKGRLAKVEEKQDGMDRKLTVITVRLEEREEK